jgi:hypothetical protein
LSSYRKEIDAEGALSIFEGTSTVPFIYQPSWPDGTPWSEGEPEAWADVLIASLSDPESLLPGSNPSQPTLPRPDEEE